MTVPDHDGVYPTLAEFLLARIDEDEAAARAAAPGPWTYSDIGSVAGGGLYDPTVRLADMDWDPEPGKINRRIRRARPATEADATGEHIARHDPARVLAECEAKRRIVERCAQHSEELDDLPNGLASPRAVFARQVLKALALPYTAHPEYRDEWRP